MNFSMSRYTSIVIAMIGCLGLQGGVVPADDASNDSALSTRFVRGGGELQLEGPADRAKSNAVLKGFGRTWGNPITSENGHYLLTLPSPRIAVPFEVVLTDEPDSPIARIVVYPSVPMKWNEKYPLLVDRKAPRWLREWLRATQLPAEEVDLSVAPSELRADAYGAGLLLVGREASGPKLAELAKRQSLWNMNVIAFDAEWLQPLSLPLANTEQRSTSTVSPSTTTQFRADHGLESLGKWAPLSRLPRPASVSQWPGLANRRSWFSQNDASWVEEIAASDEAVVLTSNVDWSQHLGSEAADVLFHELLRSCAEKRLSGLPSSRYQVVIWPTERKNVSPVLRIALDADAETKRLPAVNVLDVRGSERSKTSLPLKRILEGEESWIVLGDDDAFSAATRTAFRERIAKPDSAPFIWLENDRLPDNVAAEIQLMQTLTEFGVSLPMKEPNAVTANAPVALSHPELLFPPSRR